MPLLTQQQAWKVVQAVFSGRFGVCHAINVMHGLGLISTSRYLSMHTEVDKVPRKWGAYCWPKVEDAGLMDVPRWEYAARMAQRRPRSDS